MRNAVAAFAVSVVAAVTLSACGASVVDKPMDEGAGGDVSTSAPAFDTAAWRASWSPQVDALGDAASQYSSQVRWLADHNASPSQLAPAVVRLSTGVSAAATELVAALDAAPVPAEQTDLAAKAAAFRASAAAVADAYGAIAACGADLECVVDAQGTTNTVTKDYADAYRAVSTA